MVFVPFPNTCQVSLHMTKGDQLIENGFHVESLAPLTVGDLEAIGAVFFEWWDSHRNLVINTVTLREIDLRDLSTSSGIGFLYSDGLPLVGLLSGSAMPNSVTCAIKWGTGLTGRSFRGRTYHIGLAESQVNNNSLDSATITGLLASYNNLIGLIKTAGFTMVVASRVSNGAPRVTGVTTEILTASFADPTIDNQRKRLPGRGR